MTPTSRQPVMRTPRKALCRYPRAGVMKNPSAPARPNAVPGKSPGVAPRAVAPREMSRSFLQSTQRAMPSPRTDRAGFTLIELLIGVAITAIIALAIAMMLTMVSTATANSRTDRSIVLRGQLAQIRLRSYTEPSLAVLAADPAQGVAIWLEDSNPGGRVHLSELRILWFDPALKQVIAERVVFPGSWTEQMKEAADLALPPDSNFFAVMLAQRQAGMTVTDIVLETVSSFTLTPSAKQPVASDRVRFSLALDDENGKSTELYVVVGLPNHTQPAS